MNYILPKEVRERKWAKKFLSMLQDMSLKQIFDEATEYYRDDFNYRGYMEHKIMTDYLWSKIKERE